MRVRLHPPRRRLARRLLFAQGLVITAGAVTLVVVAFLVSPGLFHLHVERALGRLEPGVAAHLDEAFGTALLLSIGIGTATAVVVALAVSWLLSSRIARPIEDLSDTARRIAEGDLSARAAPAPVDDELADLTATFNEMAFSIAHTEETRRRLLSDLAHELRTPLATLEGYVEGLDDGVVEPRTETWATLRDATTRLRRLVDDVALVSRAEEGRLELEMGDVDPAELGRAAVAAVRHRAEVQGVHVDLEAPGSLPRVRGDRDRLAQVLANLLENALRHSSSGDRIEVRLRPQNRDVVIEVSDTGEGLTGEQLSHVFERFYRADPARARGGGSGIGLTIARAIAHAHGGEVSAHSEGPGRGATFVVRLPAARER